MFKYAGNQEGKRWWTGYYVPKQEFPDKDASEEVKKAMREKWHKEIDKYTDKEEEMQKIYPRYKHLFISAPSFNPPHALSYDARDTSLVVMSPGKKAASPDNIEMGKNMVRTMKMKVDNSTTSHGATGEEIFWSCLPAVPNQPQQNESSMYSMTSHTQ